MMPISQKCAGIKSLMMDYLSTLQSWSINDTVKEHQIHENKIIQKVSSTGK